MNWVVFSLAIVALWHGGEGNMEGRCPIGWMNVYGMGQCFTIPSEYREKDFNEAREFCIGHGGDTIVIKDVNILNYALRYLQSSINSIYTNAKLIDDKWKWMEDESDVDTSILPLAGEDSGPCGLLLASGKLQGVRCEVEHSFMCHRGQGVPLTCRDVSGYEEMGDHCYKVTDEDKSWSEARTDCEDEGGSLIIINDAVEQEFVRDLCHYERHYVWIGMTEMEHPGVYEWINGEESNFTLWEEGQPDPNTGGDGCVAVDPENDSLWVALNGSTNEFRSVCEKGKEACVCDWETFGQSCYFFNTEKTDALVWENANATCAKVGAHLVIIDSEEENQFIFDQIYPYDSFWIGLLSKPGDNFYWIDDNVMNFTSMTDKDKEDALAQQDSRCVNFHINEEIAWTPMDCHLPRHYICEVEQGTLISPIDPTSDKYCPKKWLINDDRCYYMSDEEKNWQAAQQYCQDNLGDLVSINSWSEQDFVHTHLKNDIFIGYTDEKEEGKWVWPDGATGEITNWNSGEPNGGANQNCGVMLISEGKWDDWFCDHEHPFACEMAASDTPFGPTVKPTTTAPPISDNCEGEGWVENPNTGECYFFVLEEKDHYEAQKHCQYLEESSDVNIISLSTAEEHAFVWEYIKNQHYSQQIFTIGMMNEYDLGNYWTDDSPVQFFHWNSGEPSGDGTCTEMYTDSGYFNDIACEQKQAFICEKKGKNYHPPDPPSPPDPVCPPGWTTFNRHCYYFNDLQQSWTEAEAGCEKNFSSTLASIESADENDFLKSYAVSMSKDFWIGLQDDGSGNDWHWLDGSDYEQYLNWAPNQPDDYQKNEHCGELKRDGTWNDLPCENSLGSVCKITLEVCPAGWTLWNGKCYYKSDETLPNDEAQQRCKELNSNANLVTISSLQENNYFADMLPQSSWNHWNGYKYDHDTHTWQWVDGSSSSFVYWDAGEPNNMDVEFCTEIIELTYSDNQGKWNNVPCSDSKGIGCQYIPKHFLGCEVGWKLFNDVCYFAGKGRGNYFDSETFCQDLKAQMAPVHSAQENEFFVSLIPSGSTETWIGITDRDQPESFTCTDGSNFVYSNWEYAVNNQIRTRCVAVMLDGKWEPKDCYSGSESETAVICSKPPEVRDSEPDESGCKKDSMYYQGSCYSMSSLQLSWDEAKKACENDFSHLLRIEDEQEGAFFTSSFAYYGTDVWTDVKARRYSDESFDFIFDNEKLVKYLPWDSSEPNLAEGDCILMEGSEASAGLYKAHGCEKELNFICEYDRAGYTTLPPEPTPTHGTNCLGDWDHFGGHCYKVFEESHTWNEAEQICLSYGGHLTSINSPEEETFIQQTLWSVALSYDNLWVGLELDTAADKHWTDGSSIDYLHWDDGQPDLHDHENCASVNSYSTALSCTACELHLPYICESLEGTIITTLPMPTFEPPPKCSDGNGDWYLYNDHCYKIVSSADEDPQSWDKSVRMCQAEGSYLVSIADAGENAFVESLVQPLSDAGIWIGGRALEDTGFEWVDKSPFIYDNWAPGEPNSYMGAEDCIEIYNQAMGKWNDKNCGHLGGRVCKRPNGATVPPPPSTIPPYGNCPEGWIHVVTTGRCFKLVNDYKYYDDAVIRCKSLSKGSNLVSLHTPKEMAYITVMIGMYGADAWLGLKFEVTDYVWIDQSTVDYTPWAPGEPNGQYMSENCVEAIYPSGMMNDISCYNMFGYICAMEQDPTITEPTSFPKCDPPYDNYYRYLDDCYRSEETPKSWEDAEKTCVSEGAHLASAYDMHEGAFLWILGQDGKIPNPWIGLNNQKDPNTYQWSDNWPVSYSNWGEEQPQVNVTDKNCVMLDSEDGYWYNERCNELKPFLCKHSEDQAPSPGPPVTGHCPDETWTSSPGAYCYMSVLESKSWNDANAHCLFLDGNLTSIHSDDDNTYIKHAVKVMKSSIWIGLIQKKSGFGWSDRTALDYLNWADGEPSYDYEKCTEFLQEDGKWNDMPCDSYLPFICRTAKIPDKEPTNPPLPTIPPTKGPDIGGGLSGGAIFGIVFAVLFAFAVVGFVGISLIKRKKDMSGGFSPSQQTMGVVNLSSISQTDATDA
ncbi:macrophage mannose receptor 1-like isoform X2 [Palaemon carinicauda]|uniref:macrophage mannose receptor 1-like isoform X2 n=1 Tax=Palaemon carinicauda TaxID=392227 RepID=UPI0035B65DA8